MLCLFVGLGLNIYGNMDEQDKRGNKQNQKVMAPKDLKKKTVSLFHDKGDLFFLFFLLLWTNDDMPSSSTS